MAGLEFRVLGRVQALQDGEEVAVGQSRTLNMLAGLLVRANTVVSRDVLAELTWGEAAPVNPRAALHSKISRLRRLLGESVIETVGEGYRLRAAVSQLDLLRFDSLVSRAAAAAGDEQAAAALTEAISLWQGDPLVNTDSPTLASEVVPQLTERYLLACEQWAEVSLRLGRPAEVVQRISALADTHPLREPIVRLLMVALSHDGRQAEALTVYDGLRRRLSEELGADPSPMLRDVHTAILRGVLVESGPALVASRQPRYPAAPAAGQKTCRPVAGGLLGSVMGPVRAQILLALERPRTTSELARLSHRAPSALIYHCERLAAAGLVRREELGEDVWLSRTSRGVVMVALFAEQP